jgi:hypothetical protein
MTTKRGEHLDFALNGEYPESFKVAWFMLSSRDRLSILAVLLEEAPPSSCVAAWKYGVSPSIGMHVADVLVAYGQSKRTAMLQSPQRWQRWRLGS